MTMERYAATFMALSRFASYLIPNEEKKCEKFAQGLHPRIRSRPIPLRIRNFTDLVTRATLVEEDMRANAKIFNQRKHQQPLPKPNKNKCGQPNHMTRDCPRRNVPPPTIKGGQRAIVPARVFASTPRDAKSSNKVVTRTLPLFSCFATFLFDQGATHSFIASAYACLDVKVLERLDCSLSVATPTDEHIVCDTILKNCPIDISGRHLLADLVIFDMMGFDVILGMDWLSRTHAC
ncbi:uncharacterized protein LOC122298894 [Carya illinoinensis]|uniref:uncharacterized protein LOC122298894 n=1 Tax=Carya illinoinensis TaxID=32201 RepID=UPI001C719338|nr:uncharacterized protein LOC122298894 [Carya illinoinensis]